MASADNSLPFTENDNLMDTSTEGTVYHNASAESESDLDSSLQNPKTEEQYLRDWIETRTPKVYQGYKQALDAYNLITKIKETMQTCEKLYLEMRDLLITHSEYIVKKVSSTEDISSSLIEEHKRFLLSIKEKYQLFQNKQKTLNSDYLDYPKKHQNEDTIDLKDILNRNILDLIENKEFINLSAKTIFLKSNSTHTQHIPKIRNITLKSSSPVLSYLHFPCIKIYDHDNKEIDLYVPHKHNNEKAINNIIENMNCFQNNNSYDDNICFIKSSMDKVLIIIRNSVEYTVSFIDCTNRIIKNHNMHLSVAQGFMADINEKKARLETLTTKNTINHNLKLKSCESEYKPQSYESEPETSLKQEKTEEQELRDWIKDHRLLIYKRYNKSLEHYNFMIKIQETRLTCETLSLQMIELFNNHTHYIVTQFSAIGHIDSALIESHKHFISSINEKYQLLKKEIKSLYINDYGYNLEYKNENIVDLKDVANRKILCDIENKELTTLSVKTLEEINNDNTKYIPKIKNITLKSSQLPSLNNIYHVSIKTYNHNNEEVDVSLDYVYKNVYKEIEAASNLSTTMEYLQNDNSHDNNLDFIKKSIDSVLIILLNSVNDTIEETISFANQVVYAHNSDLSDAQKWTKELYEKESRLEALIKVNMNSTINPNDLQNNVDDPMQTEDVLTYIGVNDANTTLIDDHLEELMQTDKISDHQF